MIIDFINHSQPQEVKEVKDIAYKTFELAAALRYRLYRVVFLTRPPLKSLSVGR